MRYGIRALRREPSFAATALLTLTLGIFTTTTVFTIVDAELWKPLPFRDPDQLVAVSPLKPGPSGEAERVLASRFPRLAGAKRAGRVRRTYRAHGPAGAAARHRRVGPRPARIGQLFRRPDSCSAGSAAASIPSPTNTPASPSSADRGWERVFNGAADVVGQILTLDGTTIPSSASMPDSIMGLGDEPDLFVVLDRPH